MKKGTRTETDSMGEMEVPLDAYYGPQTARAIENFPISGIRFPRDFIRALGLIKKHAAGANAALGELPGPLASAIQNASQEVADGKFDVEFPLDIFQTGSGTSTNMNANEVIARRATELLHAKSRQRVHPNDHVNHGQSSNDVIPTAIHLAALDGIVRCLDPALAELEQELSKKAREFRTVLKIGRTHLQDATPIRLGQEFGGYATQINLARERLQPVLAHLGDLALGGTAVGTGINTHPRFAALAIRGLAKELRLKLREAANHLAAQASIDTLVETSGVLKSIAVAFIKIANDIRWLGSGPRCGLGELKLPTTQPGSSIMPGKVNPVMCEMLIQVGAQVIGNDAVVTFAGTYGAFELNTMLPVSAHNLLQSIQLLATGSETFTRRCVAGLEADAAKCEANVEQSLALCTALVPAIGYDKAAEIAKAAYRTGRTVRQVALEKSGLEKGIVRRLLDQAKKPK
ncbi:MAG TPA: class II fumarate hydratase [Candidatus Dormibacteraeota bacterium]|nr:class II fumarate hydratase [Candidatus Dormibacteraeota bacterium]